MMTRLKMTRRSFMATSALSGAAVLAGAPTAIAQTGTPKPVEVEEKIIGVNCLNNCQSNCRMNAHVRNGRLVKTSLAPFKPDGLPPVHPLDERYNTICLRGLSHSQRVYGTNRILYPMKQTKQRGDISGFTRIPWDQAIKEISKKMASYPRVGNTTPAVTILGMSGSFGQLNGVFGGMGMLGTIMGATSIWGGLDYALPVGISRVHGLPTFPFRTGNEPMDMVNAKTIFLWGSNASEAHIMTWGIVADAQQNGATIVDVDVMCTPTASKADLFVQIKSGTDIMLGLAMMNVLCYEKPEWLDKPFMAENSTAPMLVRADNKMYLRAKDIPGSNNDDNGYVAYNSKTNKFDTTILQDFPQTRYHRAGKKAMLPGSSSDYDLEMVHTITVNKFDNENKITGTESIRVIPSFSLLKTHLKLYTPEYAEKYTGISPALTRRLTEQYAAPQNKPTTIYFGFGLSQYYNAHHAGHTLATLAAITGNCMKKGASIGNFYDIKQVVTGLPRPPIRRPVLPAVHIKEALEKENHPMRMLFNACANPVNNYAAQNDWIKGIVPKMECIVTLDIELTDTGILSDYLLPAAHWYETNDLFTNLGKHPFICWSQKALEPQGEAKRDIEVAYLLTRELDKLIPDLDGSKWFMSGNSMKTDEEFLASMITPSAEPAVNITPERFFKEKVVRHGTEPFVHGGDGYMPTNSGRLEFYTEDPDLYTKVAFYGQTLNEAEKDLERLPSWVEPSEAYFGPTTRKSHEEKRKKFPLHMLTEHSRWRLHSQWAHIPWLREQDSEPTIKINPADAKRYGDIKTGDYVRVINDRGSCVAKAIITNGLPEGVINMPKGWHRGQYTQKFGYGGNYQELTNPDNNKSGVAPIFYDALVRIEKA